MARKLRALADRSPDMIGAALFVLGEKIMNTSKREFVPVDFGVLRASGHVEPPTRGKGRQISVALVYGGPAAPYAIVQHEGDFKHTVGTRKYLERPLLDAVGSAARDIGRLLNLDNVPV